MSEKDAYWQQGGSAFPWQEKNTHDGSHYYSHSGMSLRDWFAGQASPFLYAYRSDLNSGNEIDVAGLSKATAETAYAVADALLAERKKG
jgi:hypothetical protein